MNLGLFLKSVGPLGLGSGLGVGGVALYKNIAPDTWKELLEREGVYLISSDGDYKAIFYDQKTRISGIDNLKSETNVGTAYSKIKAWCEDELKKKPETEETFQSTREKIVDLCSHRGINTVKGRIAQSDKTNWIEDLDGDKESKYKTIFAIYKHYSPFLEWLNEGKEGDAKVKDSDSPSSKYSELQNKCKSVVAMSYPESFDSDTYNYTYWWCQPLSYSKVEDRIKAVDASWKQANEWESVYSKWNGTEEVTKVIKGDDQETDLNKEKFKSWCEEQLKKELSEEGMYRDKYLIVKSVCREVKES